MDERVVMFVDMVDSTRLKYSQKPETVVEIIREFFATIQNETQGKDNIRFTGDGAMVIYKKHPDLALNAAENILQAVERKNLTFKAPRIQIRIGIATGMCYDVSVVGPEISGKKVDIAARLCAEVEPNHILVDEETKSSSQMPAHRFKPCERRLLLKGVPIPPDKLERFYYYEPFRFLKPPKLDHYSKGLLSLYPDRKVLSRDLTPVRIMHMATKNSDILVAGRTLIAWTEKAVEMKAIAKNKNVAFLFLISSEQTSKYLDEQQKREISKDLPEARERFQDLANVDTKHFQIREIDQLILDGIVCVRVLLPGEMEGSSFRKLIVLQDINAAPGDAKASLLLACTCNKAGDEGDQSCMAHGLYKRTKLMFSLSKQLIT